MTSHSILIPVYNLIAVTRVLERCCQRYLLLPTL